ncbi:MAG: DUF1214 domain-containing protein [Novosphingobium sp.]|nr:DUF1214 domain-containing protein [Novosphingobium sp.]
MRPASAIALILLLAGQAAIAAPAAGEDRAMTEKPPSTVAEAQAIWDRTVAQVRSELLAHRFASDPVLLAQGHYFLGNLQTVAFNMYVAPRQQYPAFYTQSFFMPFELSWGTQNPDFLNHNAFLDGAHTYRIWGNAKGTYWTTIQAMAGFWGDEKMAMLGHIDFDDIPIDANGNFEIFMGPNPPKDTGGKTWLKLDPEAHNVMLAVREVYMDWDKTRMLDLHIETLDRDPSTPMWFEEAELARRYAKAAKFVEFAWKFSSGQMPPAKEDPPVNRFVMPAGATDVGGNPVAAYVPMHFEIGADEALIIEMTPIGARYWGFQTASVWGQTNDYSYHQSSLNAEQVRKDADGKVRLVLSLSDPGVPNWLDPVEVGTGSVLLRWYKTDGTATPTVEKVALTDLRKHLPADTPTVSPAERSEQLKARARASLRRFKQ